MIAKFSHWVPNGLATPKAIIVLTPPSQADGRREVDSKVWQEFATKHGLALVGCFFQDDIPSGIEEYCRITNEYDIERAPYKADAGTELIEYLYGENSPTSLYDTKTKLLMWGFSAGGQFNYEFTAHHPRLVAGFVVNKGGIYYTHLAHKEARKVPGLFIVGDKDAPWRVKSVEGIWGVNTVAGANWDLISEPLTSHEVGESVKIGQTFFAKILEGKR